MAYSDSTGILVKTFLVVIKDPIRKMLLLGRIFIVWTLIIWEMQIIFFLIFTLKKKLKLSSLKIKTLENG